MFVTFTYSLELSLSGSKTKYITTEPVIAVLVLSVGAVSTEIVVPLASAVSADVIVLSYALLNLLSCAVILS